MFNNQPQWEKLTSPQRGCWLPTLGPVNESDPRFASVMAIESYLASQPVSANEHQVRALMATKFANNFLERWIAELRSGNFAQGREYLVRDSTYCCLGVAEVVRGKLGLYTRESGLPYLFPISGALLTTFFSPPNDYIRFHPTDETSILWPVFTFNDIANWIEVRLLERIGVPAG